MLPFSGLTFALALPSTLLTAALIWIVLKKSPSMMNHYKHVIIGTSVGVYPDFKLVRIALLLSIRLRRQSTALSISYQFSNSS